MQYNRIGMAKRLILARKYEKAKKLLRPIANKNNAQAQLLLGYLFFGGDLKTTPKKAQYWLQKSADFTLSKNPNFNKNKYIN